jgi:hypothetical protein
MLQGFNPKQACLLQDLILAKATKMRICNALPRRLQQGQQAITTAFS